MHADNCASVSLLWARRQTTRQTVHHMLHTALRTAIVAAMPVAAAGAEPLNLPACKQALAALQHQESVALAAQRQASTSATARRVAVDAVQARQTRAAVACRLQTDPPSGPTASPPSPPPASRLRELSRIAPAMPPPTALSRLPAPANSPPAGVGPQTVNLGACDDQGCWTSDGRRLLRAGPWLIGPGGYCSQQGTALRCP